jgi:hypothetical protein
VEKIWQLVRGDSPLVAAAIHDGALLRPEVADLMALPLQSRLREEDPYTARWTDIMENRLVGTHSRFEVDLNRPREKAVYIQPEDAWGLHVWNTPPPSEVVERSLANYDAFYKEAHQLFSELAGRFGRFVVFDLHTYNHQRDGPDSEPADPALNPEVNIGTGTMDRLRWASIVDGFIEDLSTFDFMGRQLDVRENIKFQGGQFARWTHQNFPNNACVLSIEFKKFFMDEWTGIADETRLEAIRQGLQSTVPAILQTLK